MGVLGLTSFIYEKSDVFLEYYRLMNCHVIIDGYSLASLLYNESRKKNSTFGGDYDKYSKAIENFLNILTTCHVTAIVVCDGGYEPRKLKTIKRRNIQRLYVLEKINPTSDNKQCFPLMLRHVFKEKVLEMGVTLLQTDFEADTEIAALAKKLDIPVLSNDSDFLIFDVKYVPMSTVSFGTYERDENGDYFIPCSIYTVDKLLRCYGGISKIMLPLLATLLGNDYIEASEFKNFYNQLKMKKSKTLKPGHRRVVALLNWLKYQSFDSAMGQILNTLKKNSRTRVRRKMQYVMNAYIKVNTALEKYLPENIQEKLVYRSDECLINTLKMTMQDLNLTDKEPFLEMKSSHPAGENDGPGSADGEGIVSCEETFSGDGKSNGSCEETFSGDSKSNVSCEVASLCDENNDYPSLEIEETESTLLWLIHESRKGNISPSVLTLLSVGTYFSLPTVQDYERPNAELTALPILQVIAGLLGLEEIRYWARTKCKYNCNRISSVRSLTIFGNFPPFHYLPCLSVDQRKLIVLETLKAESSFFFNFPNDWHIFILAIVYWAKTNEEPLIKPWHIHAMVMMMVVVNVISSKIGRFWNKKEFLEMYGSQIKYLEKQVRTESLNPDLPTTITEALNSLPINECLLVLNSLMGYFHVDDKVGKNGSKLLSRAIVHIYAQFQSCFELSVILNSLLLFPFQRCHLGRFYNGTFLYNFTINFKKRSNIMLYIEQLLITCPSVLNIYKLIYNTLKELIPVIPEQRIKKKKKKKSVNIKEINDNAQSVEDVSGSETFDDSDNPFNVLLQKDVIK